MKNKIIALLLSLFCILPFLSLRVLALNGDIQIQMHTSDKLKNNRGFNMYFSFQTNTSKNIGAFRLQVQYDSEHFSFMEAKLCSLDTDNHLLKAYAESNVVTLVFASREALEYSNSQDVFYIRFKAINPQLSESYIFQTNIMEVVDFDGKYLSVNNPTDFYINGSESSSFSSSLNSKTQDGVVSTTESTLTQKSQFATDSFSEQTENSSVISSTEDETIILQDNHDPNVKENNFPTFLILIVMGVLIFCVAFCIGRRQRNTSSPDEHHVKDPSKKKK